MIKSCYIHIPFCNNICSYCAFSKMLYNKSIVDKYLHSLDKELTAKYKNDLLDTIYIGGGTPSSLSIDQLNTLFSITNKLKTSKNIEFTIECNIDSITIEKLKLFKENKVNRLSIGIESFQRKNLKLLNRNTTKKDIIKKINVAKKYFTKINLDLIYALPNQTIRSLKKDLKELIKLDTKHISTYSLMIEPNTYLYLNKTKPIDEDLELKMYNLIIKTLSKHKFHQYEISNFSKEEYQSRHNLTYWNNEEYYGFGLSSAGYIKDRYTNTSNLNKYLDNNYDESIEKITKELRLTYELILGLRKREGINIGKINKKYNIDLIKDYDLIPLIKKKVLIIISNNLIIPVDKIYITNEILQHFVGGSNE